MHRFHSEELVQVLPLVVPIGRHAAQGSGQAAEYHNACPICGQVKQVKAPRRRE
jgi:hypothetical protein